MAFHLFFATNWWPNFFDDNSFAEFFFFADFAIAQKAHFCYKIVRKTDRCVTFPVVLSYFRKPTPTSRCFSLPQRLRHSPVPIDLFEDLTRFLNWWKRNAILDTSYCLSHYTIYTFSSGMKLASAQLCSLSCTSFSIKAAFLRGFERGNRY